MLHIRVPTAYPLESGEVGTLVRNAPALFQSVKDGDLAAFLKYHPEVTSVLEKVVPGIGGILRAMQGGAS